MGIRHQLRKTIVINALISIALIAVIVCGILFFFFMSYQYVVAQRIENYLAEQNIDPQRFKDGLFVPFGDLIQSENSRRAPLFLLLCTVVVAVVFIVSALTSYIQSKKFLLPLRQLERAAKRIADGDLDYVLSYQSDNEFDSVKDAFNEMQEKLRETIRENILQAESKQEMIAGISHDLRTPLTSIKGYVKGMQDGVASTPEKLYRYLDTISAKTSQMEVMIDRLFSFSRLDTGEEPLRPENIRPGEYLAGYVDTVAQDMRQRGLTLRYDPAARDESVLFVDCDQMSRVFANILENSAKYKNKPEGIVVIRSFQNDGGYTIEFSDDGPGVPEEFLKKMFDSFYRLDPSRTPNIKGTGLGLAISERIVKAHGGLIRAENRNGLTIIIELPNAQGAAG